MLWCVCLLSPKVCARSCDCESAAPAFCVRKRARHEACVAVASGLWRLAGHASLWSCLHHARAQVYMELVKARHPHVAQQLQKLGLAPGASVPLVHVSVAHTTNDVRRRLRSLADRADLPPSLHQLHSALFMFSETRPVARGKVGRAHGTGGRATAPTPLSVGLLHSRQHLCFGVQRRMLKNGLSGCACTPCLIRR